MPEIHLSLPRDNQIDIVLRKSVTRKEFEKLKQLFELAEAGFVEDPPETAAPPPLPPEM